MNVLQVTPRYPPHTGGVETHVAEVSERLAARGHDVTVFAADAGKDVSRREARNGVSVRRFSGFAPSDAIHVAPGISVAVRRADPDVVHAHNYHSLPILLASIGVSDARFVVTPHYHGGSASDLRDRLLSLYRPLGGWVLRQADEVIAVSEWEREQLREHFEVDANVIPNGIDVKRFETAEPTDYDVPYLLCVGRLEEYKGVHHVIRALPDLPDYHLFVAGSGAYRGTLEQVSERAGVSDRVTFLGYVPDDELPSFYAGAEVYLTLSEFEAYGITVAEALASGTPCVVRGGGALDDWLRNAGVVSVADSSPRSIAAAVREAEEAQPDATGLLTWETVTERVESIYWT